MTKKALPFSLDLILNPKPRILTPKAWTPRSCGNLLNADLNAAVVIYTLTKKANPFSLDLVPVPTGNPVKPAEP